MQGSAAECYPHAHAPPAQAQPCSVACTHQPTETLLVPPASAPCGAAARGRCAPSCQCPGAVRGRQGEGGEWAGMDHMHDSPGSCSSRPTAWQQRHPLYSHKQLLQLPTSGLYSHCGGGPGPGRAGGKRLTTGSVRPASSPPRGSSWAVACPRRQQPAPALAFFSASATTAQLAPTESSAPTVATSSPCMSGGGGGRGT